MGIAKVLNPEKLHVTLTAMGRRLDLECMSPGEREYAYCMHPDLVRDAIREEIAHCRKLTDPARLILSTLEREARRGRAIPLVARHRGAPNSKPFSHYGGQFYLSSDGRACFLIDNNAVVTVLFPTDVQLRTIEALMGVPDRVIQLSDIARRISEMEPSSGVRRRLLSPNPVTRLEAQATDVATVDISWTFVILDEVATGSDQNLLVADVAQRMHSMYGRDLPSPIFGEPALPSVLRRSMRQRLRLGTPLRGLPTPPVIDWSEVQGRDAERRVRLWCQRVIDSGRPGQPFRSIVTFVSAQTAELIFEVMHGASNASWRKDPDFFRPGSIRKTTLRL